MAEPVSDEVARNRWLAIQGVRLAGVLMIFIGILLVRGAGFAPEALGWVLLPIGLAAMFLAPRLLARRWRSPTE